MAAKRSYLDRFLTMANHYPRNIAVSEASKDTSYGELASLARRIAQEILQRERGSRVLVHLPQTAAAYGAMFGVGMAGGIYSTTSITSPVERRRLIFEAFEPDAIVTNAALRSEAAQYCPSAFIIDVDNLCLEEIKVAMPPHRLAYVMFTSGSTGRPKGVMISKEALTHYVDWAVDTMSVTPSDRWSQHPNIAFDLSVLDIYGALCGGATLVPIVGSADLLMPAKAIRKYRLTIWNSVPSVVTSMIKIRQATVANFESLRLMTFCGEALQEMHLDAIFTARPDLIVHNTYGPTEATVSCTQLRLTSQNYREFCQSTVALGHPIPGMSIDLLGGSSDSEGEIVIAGPQVADGYWNDHNLTSKKFQTFVRNGELTRGYFTGDWARGSGGNLFFQGRLDTQVKIRGERVELEEINAALMTCGYGFACTVLLDDNLHGIFEYDQGIDDAEILRQKLEQALPHHLIPKFFHALPEFPRNANGKVDLDVIRRRIAEPDL